MNDRANQDAMTDPERKLMQHEIDCEARYGELRTRIAEIATECTRNTRLLWVLLTGITVCLAGIFGPLIFG